MGRVDPFRILQALLVDGRATASVHATTNCIMLHLSRKRYRDLILSYPVFKVATRNISPNPPTFAFRFHHIPHVPNHPLSLFHKGQ